MKTNSLYPQTETQRNIYISVILAVLTVMTVITLIISSCLPAYVPTGSFSDNDGEENGETTGDDEPDDRPNSGNHPSVGNFSDFGSASLCAIDTAASTKQFGDDVKSKNAIVVNMSTNIATYAKGADERIQIASMTKVMTLITALDLIESNNQMYDRVEIKQEYIDLLRPQGYQLAFYNEAYYSDGNVYKVYVIDLLYALILRSGCDAALALADHLAGSEEAFVDRMNEIAKNDLGLENTNFTNVYGNDDGGRNYSTVREVGEMFNYALSNELAKKILTTKSGDYYYQETYNYNYPESLVLDAIKNRDTGDVKVLGGKSGNDEMAGYCLVSFGETSDGSRYLVVSAGYKEAKSSYADSAVIYKNYVGQ